MSVLFIVSSMKGVFKLLMTLVSAALVEDKRFGRRQLLLYGNAGEIDR